ncbi:hypothetical protein EON78_06755, partial [bacterium]
MKTNIENYLKNGLAEISSQEFYLILEKLFSINKFDIITDNYKDRIDYKVLEEIIERRLKDEPLQYI